MRIAMMGSGGIGGYYGGLLAHCGHDVTLIARGDHLAALRARGLRVHSVHGDFTVNPIQATDNPAEVGVVDWVIVAVKTPDTETAAAAIWPMIGPHTVVASLQNGVDAAERIAAIVGPPHVIAGVTWISTVIEEPGVIRQVSQFRRVVLGELDGRLTPRLLPLDQALRQTGVTIDLSTDVPKVLWTKFLFIAAISGVGSLTRLEIGDYRHVPETRHLLLTLMREVEAVAHARGVALDADVVERTLALVDNAEPSIKPSMQRDVENGRRSELESLIGVIGRMGREANLPTPAADMVYAALLPGEIKNGRP